MGGWQLEVARMTMYITFPITIFYYFNQPQNFEKWVIQMKKDLYPSENVKESREFKNTLQIINEFYELQDQNRMEEDFRKSE